MIYSCVAAFFFFFFLGHVKQQQQVADTQNFDLLNSVKLVWFVNE